MSKRNIYKAIFTSTLDVCTYICLYYMDMNNIPMKNESSCMYVTEKHELKLHILILIFLKNSERIRIILQSN